MRRLIYFTFILLLTSFNCYTQNLRGTWYHLGLLQTENVFYNQTDWKNIKPTKLDEKENPRRLPRQDIYLKMTLNENYTFSEQYFDTKNNKPTDKPLNGKWEFVQDTLKTKAEWEVQNAFVERYYLVEKNNDNNLILKIIREITKRKNGQIINKFDLQERQQKLENLIKSIGISDEDFYAENREYSDDFWEFYNIGKYQFLSRYRTNKDNIEHFNEEIKSMIYGNIFGFLPYYGYSISHERLIFNRNDELLIRYQDLSSRSEGCGTLAEADEDARWTWNKSQQTIKIQFRENATYPYEVRRLFLTEIPNS